MGMFAVGFVAAFFSALIAVRGLIHFISSHDFTVFARYQIIFGCVILLTAYTGIVEWPAVGRDGEVNARPLQLL